MNRNFGLIIIYLIAIEFVFSFLHATAQSDQNLNESFLKAIYAKDFSLMEKLLKEGADLNVPDEEGLTPLAKAAYVGDLKTIEYLLSKGSKIDGAQIFPNSPIYFAIYKGHISVVKKFLDLGIDPNYAWPNRDGGTLLITAVQYEHLEIAKLLVQRGADVNFCGNGDFSPLYRSIIYDRFSIFKFLLSKGVCLNEKDVKALSDVEWEKVKRDKKYIELLKKKGCPIRPSMKVESH